MSEVANTPPVGRESVPKAVAWVSAYIFTTAFPVKAPVLDKRNIAPPRVPPFPVKDWPSAVSVEVKKFQAYSSPPKSLSTISPIVSIVLKVIKFPAEPLTSKLLTEVVRPCSNLTVCGGVSILKLLKVFEPVMTKSPVPAPVNQMLL